MSTVVLVDSRDESIGTAEKLQAHQRGLLHRAVSVFVFDSRDRLLVQRRAAGKYHGGGLWTNTCCSHPAPGETPAVAAERRLFEEMGIRCELRPAFAFLYRADVGDGLIEHEYDHVFVGVSDAEPRPDPNEVGEFARHDPLTALRASIAHSSHWSVWFRLALHELIGRSDKLAPPSSLGLESLSKG